MSIQNVITAAGGLKKEFERHLSDLGRNALDRYVGDQDVALFYEIMDAFGWSDNEAGIWFIMPGDRDGLSPLEHFDRGGPEALRTLLEHKLAADNLDRAIKRAGQAGHGRRCCAFTPP